MQFSAKDKPGHTFVTNKELNRTDDKYFIHALASKSDNSETSNQPDPRSETLYRSLEINQMSG